jgi:CBS domain containing-hemolysin-like protein
MIFPYIAIIIMLILSAMFSGSEISYASASEIKLRKAMEERGEKSLKKAYEIFVKYDIALISILIGNNLVNIASSALATVIALSLVGDHGTWIATLVMTVLIIIFGEIAPKIMATRHPERFAQAVAGPLSVWMAITRPFVRISRAFVGSVSKIWEKAKVDDAVTEDDLETIFETAEDEGVVDEETADLLQGALDFDDVPAYEIITPRVDMEALDIEDSDEKLLDKILKTKYSRLPVYRETPDKIIGQIYVNHVLRALADGEELNIQEMMMEPQFVYKTTPISDVLTMMRKNNNHLVIVTDEYGGTMGCITMEDVLEQLVGEIWDEKDDIDEEFVEKSETEFEVDGDMRLEDFFDEFDMEQDEEEIGDDNATIGGWAIEKLESYPRVGDSFTYKDLKFTVTECDEMRVLSLKVQVIPHEEPEEQ